MGPETLLTLPIILFDGSLMQPLALLPCPAAAEALPGGPSNERGGGSGCRPSPLSLSALGCVAGPCTSLTLSQRGSITA